MKIKKKAPILDLKDILQIKIFTKQFPKEGKNILKNVKNSISRAKELIDSNEINQAVTLLDRCNMELEDFINDLKNEKSRTELFTIDVVLYGILFLIQENSS